MSSDPSVHLTVVLSKTLMSSGYELSEETVLAKGDTFQCSSGKLFVIVHFTVRSLQYLERAVPPHTGHCRCTMMLIIMMMLKFALKCNISDICRKPGSTHVTVENRGQLNIVDS